MSAETLLQPETALIRVAGAFSHLLPDILRHLDIRNPRALAQEYHWVSFGDAAAARDPACSRFVRWQIPVHHSWPCCPRTMKHFVEKAAGTLARKFGGAGLQTLLVGALDSSSGYYRTLASNLRGRALQLFPPLPASRHAEAQDPDAPTLFCLLGKEGLYCGVQTPRRANGFHPGGTRYVRQDASSTVSRAGAKIAEALHYLRLHREAPAKGAHWLELGASPGGMTSELLARSYTVTAVDRAPLDPRLDRAPGLRFHLSDVRSFQPPPAAAYDAILCDLNGRALDSISQVIRLSSRLRENGLVVFTLKTTGAEDLAAILSLCENVERSAAEAGLELVARTHLTYNRHEFTLFLTKRPESARGKI